MSVASQRIEGAFTEGYWAVEVRLRGAADPVRYLCHARNDRDARRMADDLTDGCGDAMGYGYHRLRPPTDGALPRLGGHALVAGDDAWRALMTGAGVDRDNLNSLRP